MVMAPVVLLWHACARGWRPTVVLRNSAVLWLLPPVGIATKLYELSPAAPTPGGPGSEEPVSGSLPCSPQPAPISVQPWRTCEQSCSRRPEAFPKHHSGAVMSRTGGTTGGRGRGGHEVRSTRRWRGAVRRQDGPRRVWPPPLTPRSTPRPCP